MQMLAALFHIHSIALSRATVHRQAHTNTHMHKHMHSRATDSERGKKKKSFKVFEY